MRGSVLDQDVDAIVNAANTRLMGGGGVDGAIHRGAGKELFEHLQKIAPHGTKAGTVVVSPGFNLKQKYVLHTPGPFWSGGNRSEAEVLESCYRSCLSKAAEMEDVRSIAFCSIATGAYRFPLDLAAAIALRVARSFEGSDLLDLARFTLYAEAEFKEFDHAFNQEPKD